MSTYKYIYISIHTHTHTHVYIYIYIYIYIIKYLPKVRVNPHIGGQFQHIPHATVPRAGRHDVGVHEQVRFKVFHVLL